MKRKIVGGFLLALPILILLEVLILLEMAYLTRNLIVVIVLAVMGVVFLGTFAVIRGLELVFGDLL